MIWSEIPLPRSFLRRVSYTSIDLSYCFLTRLDPTCNKDKRKAMKKLIKIFLHQVHGTAHLIERVGGWDDKLYFSWISKRERNKDKDDFTCKSLSQVCMKIMKWTSASWKLKGCLVCIFKQLFLVFKQYFTYFNILFHSHIFSQIFSNNNFQFLKTCIKQARGLRIYFQKN